MWENKFVYIHEQQDSLKSCPMRIVDSQFEAVDINHEQKWLGSLYMFQEMMAHPYINMSSFDQTRKISHANLQSETE